MPGCNGPTMSITKSAALLAILSLCVCAGPCLAQHSKIFNWLPANDESLRLDPANYHAGLSFHTFGNGGDIQDCWARQGPEKPPSERIASSEADFVILI